MTLKIETYDFENIVACFWQVDDKKWEGVINSQIDAGNFKMVKNEKAIILFRIPVPFSSESNQLPL